MFRAKGLRLRCAKEVSVAGLQVAIQGLVKDRKSKDLLEVLKVVRLCLFVFCVFHRCRFAVPVLDCGQTLQLVR